MPELIGYLRGVHAGVSGARDDRAGLALMLAHAHEGDTVVVVVALDWLGRSLSGTIRTVATLAGRGIVLWLLRESSTPYGRRPDAAGECSGHSPSTSAPSSLSALPPPARRPEPVASRPAHASSCFVPGYPVAFL